MALPVIGYKTLIRNGTITDPGTETGYAIASIQDYRSYTLWKSDDVAAPINIDIDLGVGNTETADYIAIINHNLNTLVATVEVLGGNASPAANQVQAPFAPGEDTVTYQAFTQSAAYRYWRIQITDAAPPLAAAPYIGQIFLGNKTELPQYMTATFDPYFRQVEVVGARSEGGHYLGTLLRGKTHRGEISFGEAGAAKSDWDSDLTAFLDDHALKRLPFIFVLDTAEAAFDTPYYLKMVDDGEVGRQAVGGSWQSLALRLPVEEAYREPA